MKLIVQIPCFNEEHTLPQTVADIPRAIPGIDRVEVMIVDDGSTDRTIEIAHAIGVDHVVRHRNNRGLERTFRTGLDAALKLGADIIVNTDGDNQYFGQDIPKLIQPIMEGKADIVVGDRQTHLIPHFSPVKKLLQKLGSATVRYLSGTQVPDTVSGFRAIRRDAALKLNIVSPFSYTVEMLIQAGKKHMAVAAVPIRTNAKTRPSRLFKSNLGFIARSLTTMLRMYAMYQPARVFLALGLGFGLLGALPIFRFLVLWALGQGDGHIQSLVLGGALFVVGIFTFLAGLLSDLMSHNRQLLEMTLERVRRPELREPELPGLERPPARDGGRQTPGDRRVA
ncbi:MAG: glycosyltransferase family 2 protein [Alphaproteobacteria bacterium]|nr:glycosyltransferase family 2 protein [Alphaproteobacteria bacterium]